MDHGLDAVVGECPFDSLDIGDRSDDVSITAGRNVETDHTMPGGSQLGGEVPAEPPGRAGQENAHASPS